MILGITLLVLTFTITTAESYLPLIYSLLGIIVFVFGFSRQLKTNSQIKKLIISCLLILAILAGSITTDYINVKINDKLPIYSNKIIMSEKVTKYHALFYDVYSVNTGTKNEYHIIDKEQKLSLNNIPVSPFNKNKSAIDNIIEYKSKYIGDNSNTSELIYNLPLSEYGYVIEINDANCTLTIDYHTTAWYKNDDLYIQKSLIYNSICIFSLIDNVKGIKYNFRGSSYQIERSKLEKLYPAFSDIVTDGKIDKDNFNKYTQQKINDDEFVEQLFSTLFIN